MRLSRLLSPLGISVVGLLVLVVLCAPARATPELTAVPSERGATAPGHGQEVATPRLHANVTATQTLTRHVFLPIIAQQDTCDVVTVRQLTACENQIAYDTLRQNHHILIRVVDKFGSGLNGVPVKICWGPYWHDCALPVTQNLRGEPGRVDFSMFIHEYWVEVQVGTGLIAGPISSDIDRIEICEETGEIGNSRYHYSFEVTFTIVG